MSAAIGAMPVCASSTRGREAGKPAAGRNVHEPDDEATRSMQVEGMPEASLELPFILDATLHVRRLEHGVSVSRGEIRDGGTVMSADRLQLFARTSQDAHMYVAFCSQKAGDSRIPGLSVFPPQGSIFVQANEVTIAPDKAAEIVLDDEPGREVLYLILSRRDLSATDPHIAEAIAAAKRGAQTADCGDLLDIAARGAPKVTFKKRNPRGGSASISGSAGGSGYVSNGGPKPGARAASESLVVSSDTGEPILDPVRGGKVVWMNGSFSGANQEATGLVVLRYGLTHVPATP